MWLLPSDKKFGNWLLRKLKEAQKRWAEPECTEGVGGARLWRTLTFLQAPEL